METKPDVDVATPVSIAPQLRSEFAFYAQDLIDPFNGLHGLEWCDPQTCYRWSGAWPSVKLIESVNRASGHTLVLYLLGMAAGLEPEQMRCTVDSLPVELTAENENGLIVLKGEVPSSTSNNLQLEISSPLVTEESGGRKLGFALISLSLKKK
jgi:hypothetical protein